MPRKSVLLSALCLSLALSVAESWAQGKQPGVDKAIRALGEKDPAIRWASVTVLSRFGAAAVPSLRKALANPDERIRANAALALGRIGPPAAAAVPDLAAALSDPVDPVRENAAGALGEVGPDARQAVDALIVCLSDRDPYVNGRSAETLSRIGPPAVPGLIRTLESASAVGRWSAAIALGKIGREASPAVPVLTRALSDASENVRWGAAVALGNVGDAARPAVPALLNALSDRDQDVRSGASLALDQIDPPAVEMENDWHQVAATVDTLLPRLMKETHVPGVSVALISDRRLVWSAQYGTADIRNARPVSGETMFEACSMSKPILAWLVMKLIESGELGLDRPLVSYLDPRSLRGQPDHAKITARMVLSHSSGLPNWRKDEEERDGPLPVTFEPGSRFGYSGEGIYYLQKVVEKISGEPLDMYARRMLFDPLGLQHMSFVWTDAFDSLIAAGHDSAGAYLQKTRYTHPNAAYSLYTSADDYARFITAILNPGPTTRYSLSQRSVDTMLSRQIRVDVRDPIERPGKARGRAFYWGLGWAMNATPRGDIVHHSGSNRSGFRCFTQFCPSTGSGIVIMTNGTGGS